jgi:hypothetical protein
MRKLTLSVLILASLVWALPARAEIGALDAVPAATLLLPYFEVDLTASPTAKLTMFSIGNASSEATLTRVTLWSELGVPTYAFNVYLTGYDVEYIDLRLVFQGILPRTAAPSVDPTDTISHKGPISQDISFPGCGLENATRIPAETVTALRNAHTGAASSLLGDQCGAPFRGDSVARGFVTVDTMARCTTLLPAQAGYFDNVSFRNILFGSYTVFQNSQNYAYADTLVHIEASTTNPLTDGAGDYTFYGRLASVNGTGIDHRESLPSRWMSRFINGGVFTQGTSLFVWRDAWPGATFPCGGTYARLDEQRVFAFDEQENPTALAYSANHFPLATEWVQLGSGSFEMVPDFGVLFLDLNRATAASPFSSTNQAHISTLYRADGRFAGLLTAWVLDYTSVYMGSWNLPACANGVDDDNDGFVDFPADPGCESLNSYTESPQCNDNRDNDDDGLIDMADPGCSAAWDPYERDR